ncbi:hypothetical protein L1887_27750 [Cichorium endivia]|nr:hypothetical protein L1887_27750 [Cichorium endivia]
MSVSASLYGWDGFDPSTKKWMELPEIPVDDNIFTASHKESLAVGSQSIDGFWARDLNDNILKSVELYDSRTGSWTMLPDMHYPRKSCSGFFMDEKFYVIGGMTSPNDLLTCGEEYDLKTKKWRKIDGMNPDVVKKSVDSANRVPPPVVAVVRDELYAVEHLSNMLKKYNKKNNSWDVLGRLPIREEFFTCWGMALKTLEDRLLFVAGKEVPGDKCIVLNTWNPKSGVKDGILDWQDVLAVKTDVGSFVYNCDVIYC